jgi:cell division transport system permease protein
MKDGFMSTTERRETMTTAMTEPWDDLAAKKQPALSPQAPGPIVPRGSIAGRSLTIVIAILTFLAALTAGAVTMLVGTASDWQADVGREMTIQVRPVSGRDIEADVHAAMNIAQSATGIAEVRAYTKEESEKLVEPWLGSGLALGDLPIPRLIVVKLASGVTPDLATMRKSLATQVPSASLDDHRGWIGRMRAMAETAVAVGIAILALVVVVTMLSVTFATRGAMATNSAIVEVLHYVGATDGFISTQFQRHFLLLGLKGGAIGGGLAIALFGIIAAINVWFSGTPSGYETAALFGTFSVSVAGYGAILALIALMAVVTALASRRTVRRTLSNIN